VDKIVGYAVTENPATLSLPHAKRFKLQASLFLISRQRRVDAEILRALVGVYIFGALLNRVLISIPFATCFF